MFGSFMIMATTPPCCFAFAPLLRAVARALAGDLVAFLAGDLVAFLAGDLVLAPFFAACFLVVVFPRLPAAFFFVAAFVVAFFLTPPLTPVAFFLAAAFFFALAAFVLAALFFRASARLVRVAIPARRPTPPPGFAETARVCVFDLQQSTVVRLERLWVWRT